MYENKKHLPLRCLKCAKHFSKVPTKFWRFAIDYSKVNAVSEKTSFPLSRLYDVWDDIGEAKATYFSARYGLRLLAVATTY